MDLGTTGPSCFWLRKPVYLCPRKRSFLHLRFFWVYLFFLLVSAGLIGQLLVLDTENKRLESRISVLENEVVSHGLLIPTLNKCLEAMDYSKYAVQESLALGYCVSYNTAKLVYYTRPADYPYRD